MASIQCPKVTYNDFVDLIVWNIWWNNETFDDYINVFSGANNFESSLESNLQCFETPDEATIYHSLRSQNHRHPF